MAERGAAFNEKVILRLVNGTSLTGLGPSSLSTRGLCISCAVEFDSQRVVVG